MAAGCARPADVAACAGQNDGDLCETNGACLGGACHPIACGDGIVDQGEVCDLGSDNLTCNGCSLDCKSDETCGNGVTDLCKGEQCDNGVPGLSGTGCSSLCTYEFELWRDVTPEGVASTFSVAAAYDSTRGVTVIFGNDNDGPFTAEWDGTYAVRRHPRHSPRAMVQAPALAYDSQRKRTVLFGGMDWSIQRLAETWEWDGLDWQQRTPATSPPARYETMMAYDPAHARVVLFGGIGDATLRDTWEWDGTDWVNRMPSPQPKGRYAAGMAYDPINQRVLLFGGNVGTTETWSWNSMTGTWTQVATVGPPARSDFAMATDPRGNQIVLFGGNGALVDTWAWDGTAWTQLVTTAQPGPSYFWLAMGGGPNRLPAVIVVATDSMGNVVTPNQIWHLGISSSRWLDDTPPVAPPRRDGNALAYDARRGRAVMFGGGNLGDTWEYDGDNWLHVSSTGPAGRTHHRMVYDEARAATVLFAGEDNSTPPAVVMSDLWSWDGATWTPQAAGPPPRTSFAMAYDSAREVTVVFGGSTSADAQTWEWNGTSWTSVPLASPGPDPSASWTAVYDRARREVVMVGGIDAGGNPLMQTWSWDGTTWQLLCDPTAGCPAPSARVGFMLAYDPVRHVSVLFAGHNPASGFMVNNDTWEWNGAHWYETPTLISAPGWMNAAFAYDPISRRLILWGGDSAIPGTTWALGFESVDHRIEQCAIATEDGDGDGRTGCADPDCWGRCAPLCPPGEACPMDAAHPYCGDGTCSPVEDPLICPSDCP